MKDFQKDYYTGVKGIYFYRILKAIIEIGNLDKRNVKILDYGCGNGKLKKILGNKVTGFDILKKLTEIDDWHKVKFGVVVANEVFYLMPPEEIIRFLGAVKQLNPNSLLIVGTSRYSILNKIAKTLAGQHDAHNGMLTTPSMELATIENSMKLINYKVVWGMCDVRLFKFKP